MPTYQLLSGETVEYPTPAPPVANFMARVLHAAGDPAVDVNGMIELIYGPENPILDTTLVPGRPMITKAVFENPVYHVLSDQIGRKQVQLGLLDLAATRAQYTVSVPEAARRLGITPAAVRAAITARRLSGIYDNGQWWLRPESIASYRVSNRGPKRARTARKSKRRTPAKRK
jgi:hypothetical protein